MDMEKDNISERRLDIGNYHLDRVERFDGLRQSRWGRLWRDWLAGKQYWLVIVLVSGFVAWWLSNCSPISTWGSCPMTHIRRNPRHDVWIRSALARHSGAGRPSLATPPRKPLVFNGRLVEHGRRDLAPPS